MEAVRLCGLGRYREALQVSSAALRRHRDDPRLWNVSGVAALGLGLTADAEQFWTVAIARDPDYAEAHYNLGVLHLQRREFDAAARCLARALVLEPDHALALNNLGALLMELGRITEAQTLLQRSVAIDPGNAQAFNNLGLAQLELRRLDAAQASLDQAIRLNPAFAEALNSRGLLSIEAGDHEAARGFLDAAIAADPTYGRAHLNRALMSTAVPGAAWIGPLQAAYQRRATLASGSVETLDFAMGKVREELGDYPGAFEAYADGNRLHYAQHPFDETQDQATLDLLIDRFGIDLVAQAQAAGVPAAATEDSRVPIFIIGMPRSGTTLIEQILASHPDIRGAGELPTLGELAAPIVAPVNEPLDGAGRFDALRAIGDAYLARTWSAGLTEPFVVDKMPDNYRYAGLLPLMMPNARIIHVLREPMDTCWSCFVTPFRRGHEYAYDLGMLGRHYLRYQRLMAHWRAVLPAGRMLEVRYETVVADLEAAARFMLDYIGLPWSDRCLSFHENRRAVSTASFAQVRQPIYTRSIERWRRFERQLQPLRRIIASAP